MAATILGIILISILCAASFCAGTDFEFKNGKLTLKNDDKAVNKDE